MNGNNNWTMKSSWLFNQSPIVANGTVVEWQNKKCVCFSKIYCKGNDHSSCTTTKSIPLTTQQNQNSLLEPLTPMKSTAQNCCCNQSQQNITSNDSIFDSDLCCMPEHPSEWDKLNLCNSESTNAANMNGVSENLIVDDDENGSDDVDFRKSIIRINNIYNSCQNASVSIEPMPSGDNFHLNSHSSNVSLGKYKNDINL